MSFFIRCLVVFIVLWILFYIGVSFMWEGPDVVAGSVLFGGVLSIVLTLLYGWFDEMWIQHRSSS
ncbi:hypothetical protein SAMN06265218_105132 [Fodinibius sediminis]|uniref:Uncharacterized protein n=1 Tax=Fodinibius sediminis TaxID=1214077 RepID=A0A521C9T7_9BACT|nr:hypothetical protein SAMN06265218_105132 [Fodinibius sediminis]